MWSRRKLAISVYIADEVFANTTSRVLYQKSNQTNLTINDYKDKYNLSNDYSVKSESSSYPGRHFHGRNLAG